jgi:hypothetical protein
MTERELDQKIDKAPAKKVRECLKEIASLWFSDRNNCPNPMDFGTATFDKPIDGDIIEAVTGALQSKGFCPPEGE